MRSDHGFYLDTIAHLVCTPVYDPPPLENFICKRHGSTSPDAQPNPTHILQAPLSVYHTRSEFPPGNL